MWEKKPRFKNTRMCSKIWRAPSFLFFLFYQDSQRKRDKWVPKRVTEKWSVCVVPSRWSRCKSHLHQHIN